MSNLSLLRKADDDLNEMIHRFPQEQRLREGPGGDKLRPSASKQREQHMKLLTHLRDHHGYPFHTNVDGYNRLPSPDSRQRWMTSLHGSHNREHEQSTRLDHTHDWGNNA